MDRVLTYKNLDMGEEEYKSCISEWQQELVEGFVELFDNDASAEPRSEASESDTVIQAGFDMHGKIEWRLHPVEVPLLCTCY